MCRPPSQCLPRFDSGELGAFGSSCIRKVTGRE
ncbi:DUF5830 family protein [Halorhabdus tiamatea]|nr:DUF5830 family protein [Halorhabdus tiamatea]